MNYAFQDRENLYLAMDLMGGGDLRFHINRIRIFSEEQASKFLEAYTYTYEYIFYVCIYVF